MNFKFKKMRIIPLSVALITALSLSANVFAIEATFVTNYSAIANNSATVTVDVAGTGSVLTASEQVTFLVNKVTGSAITADDIIYIDQKAADNNGQVHFSFTTPTSNLGINTTIKLGTATANTIVKSSGVPTDVLYTAVNRTLTGSPYIGSTISSTDTGNNNFMTFGTLTNGTASDDVGILFTNSREAITYGSVDTTIPSMSSDPSVYSAIAGLLPNSANNGSTVLKKYPALGRNSSNQFAVRLFDSGSNLLLKGTTYYIRAYARCNKGTVTTPDNVVYFGPVRTLSF